MPVTITHNHVSAIPNDPTKDVSSDRWNEAHTVAGLGTAAEADAADFATAAQGAKADTAVQDVAAVIHAASSKATPVDADELGLVDSAASNVLKKLTWANLKATLKSYFDTLYAPSILFACTTTANSLADVNTAQSIFPSANDALTVEADSTYFFEGNFRVTNGTTAHTDAFGFGGTATFTSIGYIAEGGKHAAGSINAVNQLWVATAAMTVFDGGATTTGAVLRVRGVMRINAGGTIIPQWQFNNAPGGTNQVEANSYIRLQKVGNGSVASYGSWA